MEGLGPLEGSVQLMGNGILTEVLAVTISALPQSATSKCGYSIATLKLACTFIQHMILENHSIAPEDFVLTTNAPLIFLAGSMAGDSIDFSVNIVNDGNVEGDEVFLLQSSYTNIDSVPFQTTVTITIEDDDGKSFYCGQKYYPPYKLSTHIMPNSHAYGIRHSPLGACFKYHAKYWICKVAMQTGCKYVVCVT